MRLHHHRSHSCPPALPGQAFHRSGPPAASSASSASIEDAASDDSGSASTDDGDSLDALRSDSPNPTANAVLRDRARRVTFALSPSAWLMI